MEDSKSLTLIKPVTFGEQTYSALSLVEPTAADMEKAQDANGVTSNIKLISAVAKVPEPAVRMLCMRDFRAASDFLSSFLPAAQQTGASS